MEKKPIVNYSGTLKELQSGDTRIATGVPASSKTTGFTVYAADIGKTFLCSGTFTVAFDAASALGSSFYCTIINTGSVYQLSAARVQCDRPRTGVDDRAVERTGQRTGCVERD